MKKTTKKLPTISKKYAIGGRTKYSEGGVLNAPASADTHENFGNYLEDTGRFIGRSVLSGVGAENLIDPNYNTKLGHQADNVMEKYVAPVAELAGGIALNTVAPGLGTAVNAGRAQIRSMSGGQGKQGSLSDYDYHAQQAARGYDTTDTSKGLTGLRSGNAQAGIQGGIQAASSFLKYGGPAQDFHYGFTGGDNELPPLNGKYNPAAYADGGIVNKGAGVQQFYGATHEQGGVPFYAGEAEGGGVTPQGKLLPGEVMLKQRDGSDYILSNENNIAKDFERNRKSIEAGSGKSPMTTKALEAIKAKFIEKNNQLLVQKEAESQGKAQKAYGRFMKKYGGAIQKFDEGGDTVGGIYGGKGGFNANRMGAQFDPRMNFKRSTLSPGFTDLSKVNLGTGETGTVTTPNNAANITSQQTPQSAFDKVAPYVGDAYQFAQTLGPQHYVPRGSNPEAGNVNAMMAKRNINVDPYINDTRAVYMDTAHRIGQSTNNQAQYIDAMLSANLGADRAVSGIRSEADQLNNQYRGEEAYTRQGLGSEAGHYNNQYEMGRVMTDANARNSRGEAIANASRTYNEDRNSNKYNEMSMTVLEAMSPEARNYYYQKYYESKNKATR
jgi:hypothetical protein